MSKVINFGFWSVKPSYAKKLGDGTKTPTIIQSCQSSLWTCFFPALDWDAT